MSSRRGFSPSAVATRRRTRCPLRRFHATTSPREARGRGGEPRRLCPHLGCRHPRRPRRRPPTTVAAPAPDGRLWFVASGGAVPILASVQHERVRDGLAIVVAVETNFERRSLQLWVQVPPRDARVAWPGAFSNLLASGTDAAVTLPAGYATMETVRRKKKKKKKKKKSTLR
eukprot:NODE_21826_length_735_cov_2.199013.p1 GENE.NODE_21826_length_735_cov_2.199013~~NODE_21826_length_735_cov_2.199013.p1  ORF type:complete len:172 (-),score=31.81 NODE_21826_length_735_cov_2.199013:4-519(-)